MPETSPHSAEEVTEQLAQRYISNLANEIQLASSRLDILRQRETNGVTEIGLLDCQAHSIDLARGYVVLHQAKLLASLQIIARGLFESLVWTNWIVLSEDNAKLFSEAGKIQYERAIRKNVNLGEIILYNEKGEKQEAQESIKQLNIQEIAQIPSVEKRAREAGLGSLYAAFYPIVSLTAHANVSGLRPVPGDMSRVTFASCAAGFLAMTDLIVQNWFIHGSCPSEAEIKDAYIRQSSGKG